MTKVLQVIGGMDRGGAETFLMNVVRHIDRERFEVVILTFLPFKVFDDRYAHQHELDQLGVKVISIKDTRFSNPIRFIRDVKQVIEHNDIDVIHSHIDFMSALPLLAAKLVGIKRRIAHSHNTSNPKLTNPANKVIGFVCKRLVRSLSTGRVACGELAGKWLFDTHEFSVIENAIDLGEFAFDKKYRNEARQEHGIAENDFVILNVARLEPVKNQTFLIRVFAELSKEFPCAKLLIVGQGSMQASLENEVAKLGVSKNVEIFGSGEVRRYYSASDIFVLPSFFEGFPFVAVEAQANGLPSLFSDAVSKEVALTSRASFLSLEDDAFTWAKHIENALKSYDKRSRKAEGECLAKFDVRRVVKLLEHVYE